MINYFKYFCCTLYRNSTLYEAKREILSFVLIDLVYVTVVFERYMSSLKDQMVVDQGYLAVKQHHVKIKLFDEH